jgi:hypothetical protein
MMYFDAKIIFDLLFIFIDNNVNKTIVENRCIIHKGIRRKYMERDCTQVNQQNA